MSEYRPPRPAAATPASPNEQGRVRRYRSQNPSDTPPELQQPAAQSAMHSQPRRSHAPQQAAQEWREPEFPQIAARTQDRRESSSRSNQEWRERANTQPRPAQEWLDQSPAPAQSWERTSMQPRSSGPAQRQRMPSWDQRSSAPSWDRTPMQPVTPQGWREPALAGSAQRPAQVPQAQQAPQRSSRAPHSSQSQGTQGPQRPAKPRRKSRVLPFLMILVLVATLCVGSYVFIIYRDVNRQADVFYDGVFASGVHLGGMTQQEAYDALAAVEQQKLAEWKVDITYNATLQSLTAADIDLQLKLPDQIAAAWVIGREGDLFTRWRTINALRTTPSSSEGGIFYSAEKLDRILQLIQEGITAEAKNAEVVFSEEDKTFVFTREEYGATLDVEPIRAQIEKSITTLSSSSVQLQPEEVAPAITLADLESEHALIVSVSTPINKNSEEGRNQNVRLALSRIDGLRIDPGKKFSFNDTVGKRTEKNGFQPAKEIESGEYTIGIGGGVCQVSTTLYQAVVRAGLKIDKREPHAIPSNYSEMGQDATVSDGRIDFVFRNNSSAPIYIVARFVDGKQKKCVVEIYGKPLPDGISYVLESRQVGVDIEPDVPIEYRKDKKQEYVVYSDKEYELSPKRLGHKIQTYLVALRSDGLEIDRKLITTDVYQPKPAIVYVGTTTR